MNEVNQIEQHIKALKSGIAKREQVLKLSRNRDFKDLIIEGFCVRDSAKYVQQAGDPNLNQGERDDALALAMAGGHLKRYLSTLITIGNNCEAQLLRAENELESARAEEHIVEGYDYE